MNNHMNEKSPWIAEAPRQVSYDIPEGIFPAKLEHITVIQDPAKVHSGKDHKWTWQVEVPGHNDKKYLAIRRFVQTVEAGSELRFTLNSWVGEDFFQTDGAPVDFYDLRERHDALVLIRHHHNSGYPKPAVVPYRFFNVNEFENVHQVIGEHSFADAKNLIVEHLRS